MVTILGPQVDAVKEEIKKLCEHQSSYPVVFKLLDELTNSVFKAGMIAPSPSVPPVDPETNRFYVGQLVKLRSGSPEMIIMAIHPRSPTAYVRGQLVCRYFHIPSQAFHMVGLLPFELEPVQPERLASVTTLGQPDLVPPTVS